MTNDPFTNEELDKLYNLVQDEYDEVMCGDWEAVKKDIADLHVLMSKLIYANDLIDGLNFLSIKLSLLTLFFTVPSFDMIVKLVLIFEFSPTSVLRT